MKRTLTYKIHKSGMFYFIWRDGIEIACYKTRRGALRVLRERLYNDQTAGFSTVVDSSPAAEDLMMSLYGQPLRR